MSKNADSDPRDDLEAGVPDAETSVDDDAEGHSMQMLDLARTMSHDRAREAEQAARSARMRDNDKPKGWRGLFRRGS